MGQIQELAISSAIGFTVAEPKEAYKVKASGKLLIDESPLQLLPTLACNIGDRHATLLQQLYYLENKLQGEVDEHGDKWIRVVIEGKEKITWCNIMPYLEKPTIRQILKDLEDEGFIKSRNFTGRPLYYRVDRDAVDNLTEPVARIRRSKGRGRVITPSIVCKSDDTSIVYKSDDNHLKIRPSSSENQTIIVCKSDASEITLDSKENNTDSQAVCVNFSPLAIVMANALGLSLEVNKNLTCINLTIEKLQGMYPDDVTETNIIKVSSSVLENYGASPAKVYSQWQKVLSEKPKTEAELRAKELQAKNEAVANRIKEICKPPCAMGWEHKSVKAKKQLLMDLSATIVANQQESKLDNFTWYGGNEQPTIDQFNRAWVDHASKTKGDKKHEGNERSNERFTVPTGGALERASLR